MPEDLIEAHDWIEYHKHRAEEAEAEIASLEEENAILSTRLIQHDHMLISVLWQGSG